MPALFVKKGLQNRKNNLILVIGHYQVVKQKGGGIKQGARAGIKEALFKQVADCPEVSGNKITVVGIGMVGMACAVSILAQNISNDLCLVDVVADKLQGEMMDLQDASSFLNDPRIRSSIDFAISANSKLIIITAGVRQKEGETRLSLLQRNADILKGIIPKLVECSPNAILLMVSNPVDIMTYVAWKISGLPKHRVVGSGTNLDSSRFCFHISQRLCISPNSCHGIIIGEHGDSSIAVWSSVNVAGVRLSDINPKIGEPDDPENWQEVHNDVINAANDVIKLKGYTSWAIGFSVANIASAILRNANSVLPLSVPVLGEHGIDKDVFLSLPCVIGSNGVTHIVKQNLNESEIDKLKTAANTMIELQDEIVL